MTTPSEATCAAWQRAGESRDAAAAADCCAAEVEVISPLTAQFRFRGRDQVRTMLEAAYEVIDVIAFHTEVGDESTRAVFYRGRIKGLDFEEAQLLRFDDQGLIVELTLFGRPLPGVTAVMAAIGPALLKRQKRPGLARLVGAATAPLAVLTRVGEKRLVPLADPNRR